MIDLTIEQLTLDWSKNSMGNDHGFLFQEDDRTRRRSDAINYEWYADHPEEDLGAHEAAFVRPLSQVLPRLNLAGYDLDMARAEYEDATNRTLETAEIIDPSCDPPELMTFDEFCAFFCRYPLSSLDSTHVDHCVEDSDRIAQGRFSSLSDELKRMPAREYGTELYWSEASFLGARTFVLSAYSMLQVLGLCSENARAEVMWQYGPLVESGWEGAQSFVPGARREQTVLVATEGTSDARILKRALEVLRPDVADFFRFIDVEERHPFWGTGNLVKFAEGLVRIDVQNKVIFLLDNDAEGADAHQRIQEFGLPSNMRSLMLPRHDAFARFPSRGPEGVFNSDINGRAASIECYLDLNLPGYPPAQVLWSNYKKEVGAWQGALEYKETYTRHFLNQSNEVLRDGPYTTTKLVCVLDAIVAEAARLTSNRSSE